MNREILFKGFHPCENGKDRVFINGEWINGEWIEGFYVKLNNKAYIAEIKKLQDDKEVLIYIEVIPETVGQYTGLTDRNDKKICEGDIVSGYFEHEKIIGYIFYGSNAKFFIQRKGLFGIELNNAEDWVEVIGNIHDNPELLEATKQ